MRPIWIVILVCEALLAVWVGVGCHLHLEVSAFVVAQDRPQEPITVDGIEFWSPEEAKVYVADHRTARHFPLFKGLGQEELLFLACMAWGTVGGIIAIVLRAVQGRLTKAQVRVLAIPLLGLFSGLVVMMVVRFLPDTAMTWASRKPAALPGISLLAGLFFTAFYKTLQGLFNNSRS